MGLGQDARAGAGRGLQRWVVLLLVLNCFVISNLSLGFLFSFFSFREKHCRPAY